MLAYLVDWLNLFGRWLHLITGIAWIGASFYFIWLDDHLRAPTDPELERRGVGGELWAVHGGGFYNAQKYRGAPPALPPVLHWFKWEAYSTLLSGLFLLLVLYYFHAEAYLIDRSVADITPSVAVTVGIASLVVGWLVYDGLCRSPLARSEQALVIAIALYCIAAAWILCHVFSGRAAFLHFGAMLGTIMVLNVYFVIIPGQRAMVDAAREGRAVDPVHGLRGKQRSVHNTYFTLPVLFAMISNHYAAVYNAPYNWLVLVAFAIAGALVRVYFVARHRGRASPVPVVAGVVLLACIVIALRPATGTGRAAGASTQQIQAILATRCAPCHAATPTFAGFTVAPKGVVLDQPGDVAPQAQRVREQVATRAMPLGNLTQMTDDERQALLAWIDAGARAP
jgi:uncharacterized membrane protein